MKNIARWTMVCCCAAFLVMAMSPAALAAVSGACVNCHTMHSSQDGTTMGSDADGMAHLTLNSCIGCHTSGGVGGAPVVDGRYNVDSCAGGTFKDSGTSGEIVASDAGAHNVDIVMASLGEDDTLTAAIPGLTGGMNGGKGSTSPAALTCAGSNGCHGDATVADNDGGIRGFHHGGKAGFRYLQVAANQDPILGKGASDWEAGMSGGWSTGKEHNVYSSSTTQGISKLCANCHPNFHSTVNTSDGTNWLRHPTDNAIPTTDGWSATVNYRDNPFAFADVSSLTTGGTYDTTGAQVACVSCHRAHGSPYDDILRWNYAAQSAGSGLSVGCLGCHNKQR